MLGIIGALDIEVNGIIQKMTEIKNQKISCVNFTSGKLNGIDCVVAKCGIGKVNAAVCTQTMILNYSPDKIINTGIAGSTSSKTHIGSIVIAENVVQHDFDTTLLGDEKATLFLPEENIIYIPCDKQLIQNLENACDQHSDINYVTGIIATGDQFIGTKEDRRKLSETFDSLACEMEGGSIGQVCRINHIPFVILRSISDDSMSEESAEIEYSVFSKSAAEKAIEILDTFTKIIAGEEK